LHSGAWGISISPAYVPALDPAPRVLTAMKKVRLARKNPQQRRSQATVDVILDAAAQIFCQRGFTSATTNAIAAQAGVSIGSFYQYFSNKLVLLEALRERHVRGLWEALGSACDEGRYLPWPGALRHVIASCGAYNRRHVSLVTTLHQELPIYSRTPDRLAIAQSTRQEHLKGFLEAHQSSIKVSVDQALFMLPALARGIFTAAAGEKAHAIEDEKLVDEIVSVILGYLT
jgi:AcrR family transcriptional regulator